MKIHFNDDKHEQRDYIVVCVGEPNCLLHDRAYYDIPYEIIHSYKAGWEVIDSLCEYLELLRQNEEDEEYSDGVST